MLRTLLAHPLTRGLNIDAPQTAVLRWRIIRDKPFLRQIYQEWYASIASSLSALGVVDGPILELGSGGDFSREHIPSLISTDILQIPNIDLILDGQSLPFPAVSLNGIVMINVLHHLHQPRKFFTEATRCVRPYGVIAMVEPWITSWSRLVYTRFHHERIEPSVKDWEFSPNGPLSGANSALPWIIFKRDRVQFELEYPEWQIHEISPMMPFRYLFSGGVSMRSFMPGGTYRFWRWIEGILDPWIDKLAMFSLIVLSRIG